MKNNTIAKNTTFKKLFVTILSLAMVLALTACGGGSSDSEEGAGKLAVDIPDLQILEELYQQPVSLEAPGMIPVDSRKYLVTDLSEEEVRAAFAKAKML
jgi:hypothetical protein